MLTMMMTIMMTTMMKRPDFSRRKVAKEDFDAPFPKNHPTSK